ncbi:hypothetical protein G7Y89_g2589 [Cudoniella acicularis]|uniref:Uncharacterized protein n=1 Tax=Cudoniella acicularis TaxID=354080 RepID=A0A8H4W8H6_9HELO|nr:hypothetical protein G7Y89_g2589 [Cudoniella acicularis]
MRCSSNDKQTGGPMDEYLEFDFSAHFGPNHDLLESLYSRSNSQGGTSDNGESPYQYFYGNLSGNVEQQLKVVTENNEVTGPKENTFKESPTNTFNNTFNDTTSDALNDASHSASHDASNGSQSSYTLSVSTDQNQLIQFGHSGDFHQGETIGNFHDTSPSISGTSELLHPTHNPYPTSDETTQAPLSTTWVLLLQPYVQQQVNNPGTSYTGAGLVGRNENQQVVKINAMSPHSPVLHTTSSSQGDTAGTQIHPPQSESSLGGYQTTAKQISRGTLPPNFIPSNFASDLGYGLEPQQNMGVRNLQNMISSAPWGPRAYHYGLDPRQSMRDQPYVGAYNLKQTQIQSMAISQVGNVSRPQGSLPPRTTSAQTVAHGSQNYNGMVTATPGTLHQAQGPQKRDRRVKSSRTAPEQIPSPLQKNPRHVSASSSSPPNDAQETVGNAQTQITAYHSSCKRKDGYNISGTILKLHNPEPLEPVRVFPGDPSLPRYPAGFNKNRMEKHEALTKWMMETNKMGALGAPLSNNMAAEAWLNGEGSKCRTKFEAWEKKKDTARLAIINRAEGLAKRRKKASDRREAARAAAAVQGPSVANAIENDDTAPVGEEQQQEEEEETADLEEGESDVEEPLASRKRKRAATTATSSKRARKN